MEARPPVEVREGRREKQRSLWLNWAAVGELARDADRVIAIARDNIARWRDVHTHRPGILAALDQWEEILAAGVDAIVAVLTGDSEATEDLRQNTPFAGVLTREQRDQALSSFRTEWASPHDHPGTSASQLVDDRPIVVGSQAILGSYDEDAPCLPPRPSPWRATSPSSTIPTG